MEGVSTISSSVSHLTSDGHDFQEDSNSLESANEGKICSPATTGHAFPINTPAHVSCPPTPSRDRLSSDALKAFFPYGLDSKGLSQMQHDLFQSIPPLYDSMEAATRSPTGPLQAVQDKVVTEVEEPRKTEAPVPSYDYEENSGLPTTEAAKDDVVLSDGVDQFRTQLARYHSSYLMRSIRNLHKEEYGLDTIILCDGGHVKAHCCVLACTSTFLKKLLVESKDFPTIVSLPGVSLPIMESLISFIYDGLPPSSLDLKNLIAVAHHLGMGPIASILKQSILSHSAQSPNDVAKQDASSEFPSGLHNSLFNEIRPEYVSTAEPITSSDKPVKRRENRLEQILSQKLNTNPLSLEHHILNQRMFLPRNSGILGELLKKTEIAWPLVGTSSPYANSEFTRSSMPLNLCVSKNNSVPTVSKNSSSTIKHHVSVSPKTSPNFSTSPLYSTSDINPAHLSIRGSSLPGNLNVFGQFPSPYALNPFINSPMIPGLSSPLNSTTSATVTSLSQPLSSHSIFPNHSISNSSQSTNKFKLGNFIQNRHSSKNAAKNSNSSPKIQPSSQFSLVGAPFDGVASAGAFPFSPGKNPLINPQLIKEVYEQLKHNPQLASALASFAPVPNILNLGKPPNVLHPKDIQGMFPNLLPSSKGDPVRASSTTFINDPGKLDISGQDMKVRVVSPPNSVGLRGVISALNLSVSNTSRTSSSDNKRPHYLTSDNHASDDTKMVISLNSTSGDRNVKNEDDVISSTVKAVTDSKFQNEAKDEVCKIKSITEPNEGEFIGTQLSFRNDITTDDKLSLDIKPRTSPGGHMETSTQTSTSVLQSSSHFVCNSVVVSTASSVNTGTTTSSANPLRALHSSLSSNYSSGALDFTSTYSLPKSLQIPTLSHSSQSSLMNLMPITDSKEQRTFDCKGIFMALPPLSLSTKIGNTPNNIDEMASESMTPEIDVVGSPAPAEPKLSTEELKLENFCGERIPGMVLSSEAVALLQKDSKPASPDIVEVIDVTGPGVVAVPDGHVTQVKRLFQVGNMGRKRKGCGDCEGCQVVDDCGSCRFCRDKAKFGGPNRLKQVCVYKRCVVLDADQEDGRKRRKNFNRRKSVRCGSCDGCQRTVDCGDCYACLHNAALQPPARRKVCEMRVCEQQQIEEFRASLSAAEEPSPYSTDSLLAEGVVVGVAGSRTSSPSVDGVVAPNAGNQKYKMKLSKKAVKRLGQPYGNLSPSKVRTKYYCGECPGCLTTTPCGICLYCEDMPKFGGPGRYRQKCVKQLCVYHPRLQALKLSNRSKVNLDDVTLDGGVSSAPVLGSTNRDSANPPPSASFNNHPSTSKNTLFGSSVESSSTSRELSLSATFVKYPMEKAFSLPPSLASITAPKPFARPPVASTGEMVDREALKPICWNPFVGVEEGATPQSLPSIPSETLPRHPFLKTSHVDAYLKPAVVSSSTEPNVAECPRSKSQCDGDLDPTISCSISPITNESSRSCIAPDLQKTNSESSCNALATKEPLNIVLPSIEESSITDRPSPKPSSKKLSSNQSLPNESFVTRELSPLLLKISRHSSSSHTTQTHEIIHSDNGTYLTSNKLSPSNEINLVYSSSTQSPLQTSFQPCQSSQSSDLSLQQTHIQTLSPTLNQESYASSDLDYSQSSSQPLDQQRDLAAQSSSPTDLPRPHSALSERTTGLPGSSFWPSATSPSGGCRGRSRGRSSRGRGRGRGRGRPRMGGVVSRKSERKKTFRYSETLADDSDLEDGEIYLVNRTVDKWWDLLAQKKEEMKTEFDTVDRDAYLNKNDDAISGANLRHEDTANPSTFATSPFTVPNGAPVQSSSRNRHQVEDVLPPESICSAIHCSSESSTFVVTERNSESSAGHSVSSRSPSPLRSSSPSSFRSHSSPPLEQRVVNPEKHFTTNRSESESPQLKDDKFTREVIRQAPTKTDVNENVG